MSNNSEQLQREQQFWGRQSINWAIALRSHESGHVDRDENWIGLSVQEGDAIANDYWVESVRESNGDPQIALLSYARKIHDWCATHRKWTPPAS